MDTRLKFLLIAGALAACTMPISVEQKTGRPASPVVTEPRVVIRHVREEVTVTPVPKAAITPSATPSKIPAPVAVDNQGVAMVPVTSTQPTTITVEIRQPKQSESPITGMIIKALVQSLLDAPRKSSNATTVTIALPDSMTTSSLTNGQTGSGQSKPPYAFFTALIAILAIQWIVSKTKWGGKP